MFLPVIELPTIRTVGVVYPQKPDPSQFRPGSKIYENACRIYERALKEVKASENDMSINIKPTFMCLQEVCSPHKDNYNFGDWFRTSDWNVIREAARTRGYDLPPINILVIQFKPLGWEPDRQYMLLDR